MASKSLGTLTLDLIAQTGGFVQGMSKAERTSKQWRKQVESDLKTVSKVAKTGLLAVSGAAVAGGAALAKMAADGLSTVDSQNKLARSLDATYDSLSALDIAFSEGGVDGYEGSLARLNRRLGAAEMGTGDAAKTVEKLNLNLEELAGMDADERIAAIADAMVESGISAQEAARHAQNLGFEQREAAQFFLQGGDAIRSYREQVDAFGLSVSQLDAVKIEQANDQFAKLGRLIDGVSTQLAIQVAPIVSALSQMFVETAQDAGDIAEGAETGFNAVIAGAGFAMDAVEGINRLFKIVGSGIAIFGLSAKEVMLTLARDIVEFPTTAANELIDLLSSIPGIEIEKFGASGLGKSIDSELRLTKGAISEGYKDIQRILMEPLPSTQFKTLVADAREAADESAQATLDAQQRIKDAMSGSGIPGSGSGDDDDTKADLDKRLQTIVKHFESEKNAILRIHAEREAEIKELRDAGVMSELQASYFLQENERERQEALTEMLRANNEERLAENESYWQQWIESAQKNLQDFDSLSSSVIDNFSTGFGSAFESVIFDAQDLDDALRGIAETILRSVVNSLGQMAAQWLALQAVQAITGATATATTIAEAAAASAAWAPAAAMASLATLGGNAAPAAAALASTTALSSSLALVGMAHDGIDYVPQEGTWLLDKGERVMTSETSAKLDATLDRISQNGTSSDSAPVVNIIENPSRAGETNASRDAEGKWVIDVIVADAMSGGRASKAYQGVFGLKRQGT